MSEEQARPITPRDGRWAAADGAAAFELAPPAVELEGGPAARRLRAPRVMLVEDDFILRAHLAELLMLEGYDVTCAADGAEALHQLAREAPPSLIVVDVLMPRMDGLSFRKIQLRTPALRDIPTIALTSLADIREAAELVFADVIRKPVDVDHLVEVLARFCPRA